MGPDPRSRGAAGSQYALLLGLIGVIILASVAANGEAIKNLYFSVSNTLLRAQNGSLSSTSAPASPTIYASCKALLTAVPGTPSGTQTINPGTGNITVYCDMTTAGGGWTYLIRGGAKTDPTLTIGWTGHSSPPVCGTLSNSNLSWAHQGSCTCVGGGSYPGTGLRYTFPAATDFTVDGTWAQSSMGAGAYVGPSVNGDLARSTTAFSSCASAADCGWSNQTYRTFVGSYPNGINGQLLWRRTGNTLEYPTGSGTTGSSTILSSDKVVVSAGSGNCSANTTPMVLQNVFYREQ